MRELKHLSPTSIGLFLKDADQFYLNYLSDNKPDRFPQTKPMSVGSGFDSYVKAHLRYVLFGEDEKTLFDEYFTSSVEEHNRDFAIIAGKRCFDNYKESGALSDLIVDMSKASDGPKFEFTIASIDERVFAGGVKFLGKPDAWYVNAQGTHVILDWKVNGYCSKSSVSPEKCYVNIRDGILDGKRPTRGANKEHKDAILMNIGGVLCDAYLKMEEKNIDWARQLSIYAWLCGEGVGNSLIGAIDQLVINDRGHIRIAEHRCVISSEFQFSFFKECQEIWNICHSDHFFRDRSLEQSKERCKQLDLVKGTFEDERVKAMYGYKK